MEFKKLYQPLTTERIPEMDELYNQTHASFTGTAIRPTYLNRHPEDVGVCAWFDDDGRSDGYIRALPAEDNPKLLQCLEAAGNLQQRLAVLADLFKKGNYENLTQVILERNRGNFRSRESDTPGSNTGMTRLFVSWTRVSIAERISSFSQGLISFGPQTLQQSRIG